MPEIIVVLDKGYYLFKNDGWIQSKDKANEVDPKIYRIHEVEDEVLVGMFIYLCNIIQSWNANHYNSNYLDYLIPFKEE